MIFQPTFGKIELLSLQELRRFAITPARYLGYLKRCSLSGRAPRIAMRTLMYQDPFLDVHEEGKTLMLAPGGRYLVTCTQTVLFLWDLGHGPKSSFKCCCSIAIGPVCAPDDGLFECRIIGLRETPNALGLRVILDTEFSSLDMYVP